MRRLRQFFVIAFAACCLYGFAPKAIEAAYDRVVGGTCSASQWVTAIAVLSGATTCAQPASSDLSDATGWSTYTPTVTCNTGSLGADTVTGRYKVLLNKTVALQVILTITTVGTCLGSVSMTLPSAANSPVTLYSGSAFSNTTGAAAVAFIQNSPASFQFFFASAPIANQYIGTVVYEIN